MVLTDIRNDQGRAAAWAKGGFWGGLLGSALVVFYFYLTNPWFLDGESLPFLVLLLVPAVLLSLFGLLLGGLVQILNGPFRGASPGVPFGLGFGAFAGAVVAFELLARSEPGRPPNDLLLGAPIVAGLLGGLLAGLSIRRRERSSRSTGTFRKLGTLILGLLALAFIARFLTSPDRPAVSTRLIVVGLDGAGWNVINPLMQQNRLPNLQRLVREGASSKCRTLEPMFSPRLWASIDTGKVPEKHGVLDFYGASLSDLRTLSFWEILEQKGAKVGLYEWLITWPPPEVNGFVVPGWLARTPSTYPHELSFIKEMKMSVAEGRESGSPTNLVRQMVLAVRHGLRFCTAARMGQALFYRLVYRPDRLDFHYRNYLLGMAMDTDIFRFLLQRERPDYAFFYVQALDAVGHNYWKFYEPVGFGDVDLTGPNPLGKVIPLLYEAVDDCVGQILQDVRADSLIAVISDHGMQSGAGEVDDSGHLQIRSSVLLPLLSPSGNLEAFHAAGNLFFFSHTDDPSKAIEDLNRAAAVARSFAVRSTGEPLLLVEWSQGEDTDSAHLQVRLSKDVVAKLPTKSEDLDEVEISWTGGGGVLGELLSRNPVSGIHLLDGILILRGPGVRQGVKLDGSSILDLTPTFLQLLSEPVGRDMDGRVLTGALEPEFLAGQPIQYVESYDPPGGVQRETGEEEEAKGALEEQLKALGYVN